MFSKIVVGIDGSEMAETALKLACELAVNTSQNYTPCILLNLKL